MGTPKFREILIQAFRPADPNQLLEPSSLVLLQIFSKIMKIGWKTVKYAGQPDVLD